jgi:hypothetical protein
MLLNERLAKMERGSLVVYHVMAEELLFYFYQNGIRGPQLGMWVLPDEEMQKVMDRAEKFVGDLEKVPKP